MIDLTFLDKLDRLILLIRKNITSNYSGDRLSKATGQGLLFKDYTMYTEGDDIRYVDWRVYARTDKLFIKRFEEERNLTVHVLVDFSGSMNFGSGSILKSTYASKMAIGFAYLALKNNESFVLSTFGTKLTTYRPKKGRQHLAAMFDMLNKKRPEGLTMFDNSISSYRKFINSKSLVVIVSDFLYPIPEIRNVLLKLRKNQVKLIQVLDPVEMELNLEGHFKLKDLEDSRIMKTYISPSMRKNYLSRLKKHNSEIKKLAQETNTQFYTFSTEIEIFDAFYRVLAR